LATALRLLVHHQFVHVAPLPAFSRLDRTHDRMFRPVKMFGGVLVLRRIATADVPAFQAHPQMNPGVAHFQALFATLRAGLYVSDLIQVGAG
jgi:hypothetical protein